jgi:hypothetical protein
MLETDTVSEMRLEELTMTDHVQNNFCHLKRLDCSFNLKFSLKFVCLEIKGNPLHSLNSMEVLMILCIAS